MSTRNDRIEKLKDKLEQFRDAEMTFRYWLKAAPEKLQECVELSVAIRALIPAIEAAIGGSSLDSGHESEFYRLTGDFFYEIKSVPTSTIRRQAAGGRDGGSASAETRREKRARLEDWIAENYPRIARQRSTKAEIYAAIQSEWNAGRDEDLLENPQRGLSTIRAAVKKVIEQR